jgi:hypothetical protein
MTPCFREDGPLTLADDGVCVGCGAEVILNTLQVSIVLGVSGNTVRNMSNDGRLTAMRLPGSGHRRYLSRHVAEVKASMRATTEEGLT